MTRAYSPFLQTLYDQEAPVGDLGRGTHYSVLRALTWQTFDGQRRSVCSFHDFCVIWDEDHDERVFAVIEELQARDLLFPIIFIGERKGGLSVVIDAALSEQLVQSERVIEQIAQGQPDPWSSEVVVLGAPSGIINADDQSVLLFLRSIQMLWKLGTKPRQSSSPTPQPEPVPTSEQSSLLKAVVDEAKVHHGGHFTLFGFTTNFKCAFGTPDLRGTEGYEQVRHLAAHATVDDALRALLESRETFGQRRL